MGAKSNKSKVVGVSVPFYAIEALKKYAIRRGFYRRITRDDGVEYQPNLGGAALALILEALREKGYFDGKDDEETGGGK